MIEILKRIENEKIDKEEIVKLADLADKDIIISLCKFQNLSDDIIKNIIPKATYLAVKFIIEKQNLNDENKDLLIKKISKQPTVYKEILQDLKELKW